MSNLPKDLRYTEEHEWIKKEDGNQYRIGITDFAQDELGDIVFVELPSIGDVLKADEPFGSVESVKTVSELYAPISGKVVAVNEDLDDSPEFVNESPYEKAWMIVVEADDEALYESLLSVEDYEGRIKED
ncbi:glycine cleavage system protein GcvH [Terribacillus saccharophilus]|uniref:Glycine cleavage system H protein n=1 Tax=Terribacillus saccharophilus TaxID=361277 RepID=A0A268AFL8_9BACI|nr:glycine cleavage system protein GcvH [Terribacillus saccharophilus]PAD22905.1 glycine cleavage system protein H [Terribacillus saccharophilus]PAF17947.1 glycine cleavage system protein H [Terribacillus saccharophilus]PAF22860.1 glycine cleavage system protein H [Terribacillus saccharophilus]PAF37484.1 glycine cleavage system protein H [Terribacillus saccharophilus]PAF37786.1 glycine cleavage system protein H [Terribacillus saccharophilus]